MEAYYELDRDRQNEIALLCRDYATWPAHFHRQVEILFVKHGDVDITVNDMSYELSDGDISFADSFDMHHYVNEKNADFLFHTIIIPPKYTQTFHNETKFMAITNPVIRDRALCEECIGIMTEMEKHRDNHFLLQAYVNVILGKMLERFVLKERVKARDNDLMCMLLQYVNEHLSEQLSLNGVSEHFGFSPTHFSRIFRNTFKCRFKDYITALRLERLEAKIRENPDQKIASAIYDCGFSSIQTFYRCFEKTYHKTPARYFQDMKTTKTEY